jgi:hypothetical protein
MHVRVCVQVCPNADLPDCARWNVFWPPYSTLTGDAITCGCAQTGIAVTVRLCVRACVLTCSVLVDDAVNHGTE